MVQAEWEDAIRSALGDAGRRARWARNAMLMIRLAQKGHEIDILFAGWLAVRGMRRSRQTVPESLHMGWAVVEHLRHLRHLAERHAANGGPTGPGLHIGRDLDPFDHTCMRLSQCAAADRMEVEHRLWRARPLRRTRAHGATRAHRGTA